MGTEVVSVQVLQLDEYTFTSLALKQLALKQYMGTIHTCSLAQVVYVLDRV